MKKLFLAAITLMVLNACNNPKDQEKAALDDVIKLHDKVMGHDEQLMQNKMKLDTLLKIARNDEAKTRIIYLIGKINKADSIMSKWMQNFDPAQKGKTHEEIMNYISTQKKQITEVDSVLTDAVKTSSGYFNFKKK